MILKSRRFRAASPAEARRIQAECAASIPESRTEFSVRDFALRGTLAAADVAYDARDGFTHAALVLWDVPSGRAAGKWAHAEPASFPYVPGLLSFREIPPLVPLFRRIGTPVDLILCDGQGLAHPRRFGLACHLGLLYETASLGWAKSLLCGRHDEPESEAGSAAPLMDRGEQTGWAFRSRTGCRPVYISPGYGIGLEESLDLARLLMGPMRQPDPARAAHALSGESMRRRRR